MSASGTRCAARVGADELSVVASFFVSVFFSFLVGRSPDSHGDSAVSRFPDFASGDVRMLSLRSRWYRLLPLAALIALPGRLVSQAATITGHVTGEGGVPLVGVTVSINGMGLGSMTTTDGRYSFTVPASRVSGQLVTLSARRVGYAPGTAQVTLSAGTITHDFVLTAAALQLEQVIVTGAGTSQVRERIGSTINSVDPAQLQRQSVPQNAISELSGTTPNVRVNTQSGEPGSSAFVLIRGATSVTST